MLFRRTMVAVGAAALVTIPGAAAQAASVTDARLPAVEGAPTAGASAARWASAGGVRGAVVGLRTSMDGPRDSFGGAPAVVRTEPSAALPAGSPFRADSPAALRADSPAAVWAAPSPQDEAFLRAANEINLAGIAHGRIAWAKTGNAEVKRIAGRLMVDHIRLNAKVSEAARKLKIRLGFTPNAAQQALAERYQAASAGSFDALYLSTQLELHQQAKRIADAQIAEGRDASLKRVAADSAPVLAGHQALLKEATN
jgi:putative membrane protein